MKHKQIKQIEWRPDLFEKPLKQLFVCADQCRDAGLYKLPDGKLIYHAYWLNAHGIGPDHCTYLLEKFGDLEALLEQDVEYKLIDKNDLKKLLEECKEYFD